MPRTKQQSISSLPQPESVTPRQVDDYGKLCSELKALEARKEQIRTLLLVAFTSGVPIPTGDCCVIDFIRTTRRDINWKDQTIELARAIYGNAWPAYIMELESNAPTAEIIRVTPRAISGVVSKAS